MSINKPPADDERLVINSEDGDDLIEGLNFEDDDNQKPPTDFTIFSPLINDILKYANKIGECYENAEYNKRVVSVLLKRINSVTGEAKTLLQLKNDYSWFFENGNNYPVFQEFVKIIEQIQNFVVDISQLRGVVKYYNDYRDPEFSMDRKFYIFIQEFEKFTKALTNALKGHLNFGKLKVDQVVEDEEAITATSFDPTNRPALAHIFRKLFDLSLKNLPNIQQPAPMPNPKPKPLFSRTVQDAINIHKSNGDRKVAYETFCYYANLGDSTAKYWVGYFLFYNSLNDQQTAEQRKMAKVRAAQYFKETADKNLPEAQVRYANCLWQGEGVEKNVREAVEYFKKSADNGNPTAMYNVGSMYFNGTGVSRDKEKGEYYLRLAALNGQPKACEMCKKNHILL
ncbi:348_t:CDS:2 [Ambispora leptoticha]|uniref:348_t:CDS:1 n=1 Tax=Ambispora leptoticha TaxID=144679 RepID=A0A9N9HGM1_9GLOM|nr:348_t:CDS:2 [Ambispora leptoticha]